jgi:hypothetical protein
MLGDPKRDKNITYFGFSFSKRKIISKTNPNIPPVSGYFCKWGSVSKHELFFALMFDGETCDRFLCQKDDEKKAILSSMFIGETYDPFLYQRDSET